MAERVSLLELAKENQHKFDADIVLAKKGEKLMELHKEVCDTSDITWITTKSTCGNLAYRRSATLVMLKAIYDVIPREKISKVKVDFSLSKGYYCVIRGDVTVNEELLDKIRSRMKELVEADIPIVKQTVSTGEAIRRFREHGMLDKVELFKYRRSSFVNIYSSQI